MAKSEYGKPTFARAVLEKVGIGDGYGNPKAAPAPPKAAPKERMTVANAPSKFEATLGKRKAMLDEYANGGKIGKLVKTQKLEGAGGKPRAHAANVSGLLHGRANGGKAGRK